MPELGSDSTNSPESPEKHDAARRTGRVHLRRGGLRGLLRGRAHTVTFDFDEEVVAQGRARIPFKDLRVLEYEQDVLAMSDGESWICIDARRYRDAQGPVVEPGKGLSVSFLELLRNLKFRCSIESPTTFSARGAIDSFVFRYRLRIDFSSIYLCVAVLAILFYYYYNLLGRDLDQLGRIFSLSGFFWVLGAIAAGTGWVYFWRRSSSLVFDASGVVLRRPFWTRRWSWPELEYLRSQGVELELDGTRSPLSLSLEILHSPARAPLIIRRGIRPVLTPLGKSFFGWLRGRTIEVPEPPIFGPSLDRQLTRLWTVFIVSLNAFYFYYAQRALPPGLAREKEWTERLVEYGARTDYAFEEPWRFLAALFLHGNTPHLVMNMVGLILLAPWLGRIFGWFRGLALYLGSGILGNVLAQVMQLYLVPAADLEKIISVGASTALMGICGSLLGAIWRRPLSVPLAVRPRFRWAIPVMVVLTLMSGLVIKIMDNEAHLGGFIAGVLLVWVIPPRKSSNPWPPEGT